VGTGVSDIWDLRRGPAVWLPVGNGSRWVCLGIDGGKALAAGFCRILENPGEDSGIFAAAFEKNFENRKKCVCIWGKMGYNKME